MPETIVKALSLVPQTGTERLAKLSEASNPPERPRPGKTQMNIKTLVCYAPHLDSFHYEDLNSPGFQIELGEDVSYADKLPKLCATGGNQAFEDVRRAAESDSDTYVLLCGSAEEIGAKLFRKILRKPHSDTQSSMPPNAFQMTDENILARIQKRLADLAAFRMRSH